MSIHNDKTGTMSIKWYIFCSMLFVFIFFGDAACGAKGSRFKPESDIGLLVVWGIYVALAIFQPYRDYEAGDNKSLKL